MKRPDADLKRVIFGTAGLLAFSFFIVGCAKIADAVKPQAATAAKKAAKYYCPMHPTYTSDKPGNCPICNMALVPLESHEDHSSHEMKPTDKQTVCLRHECPMLKAGQECPMLIVSASGETPECPVCEKRIADAELNPVTAEHPEGYAAVALSPEKRRLIGVKTSKIEVRPIRSSTRAFGQMLTGGEVELAIYESDLPAIANASTVRVTVPALGREFKGRISRIPLSINHGLSASAHGSGTIFNAGSIQVMVRARLDDPDRQLRRGMTTDAEILTDLGTVTAVPEEAVFFTGKKNIVFIERTEGVYEPRAIELGTRAQGYYAVKSGVEAGETVVTSGNFLIDSESRLRSAFEGVSGGGENPSHAH